MAEAKRKLEDQVARAEREFRKAEEGCYERAKEAQRTAGGPVTSRADERRPPDGER